MCFENSTQSTRMYIQYMIAQVVSEKSLTKYWNVAHKLPLSIGCVVSFVVESVSWKSVCAACHCSSLSYRDDCLATSSLFLSLAEFPQYEYQLCQPFKEKITKEEDLSNEKSRELKAVKIVILKYQPFTLSCFITPQLPTPQKARGGHSSTRPASLTVYRREWPNPHSHWDLFLVRIWLFTLVSGLQNSMSICKVWTQIRRTPIVSSNYLSYTTRQWRFVPLSIWTLPVDIVLQNSLTLHKVWTCIDRTPTQVHKLTDQTQQCLTFVYFSIFYRVLQNSTTFY